MQSVLQAYSEDEIVIKHPSQDGIERFSVRNHAMGVEKHASLARYHQVFGADVCSSLYVFSIIRNPWDRAMSHYFSPHLGNRNWNREGFVRVVSGMQTLGDFVRLTAAEDKAPPLDSHVDRLISFENLQQDFAKVCDELKLPRVELPLRNVSHKPHYSKYYDEELVELVATKFREEIVYGGYEFERLC